MTVKRRFSGWQNTKTQKPVNLGDVIKEPGTGDLYIVKGLNFPNPPASSVHRVKVLAWDKRVTGMPEFRPASDFNIEYR